MQHYAYVIATGVFTGRCVEGSAELLALNAADGEAWFAGPCDPRCQRVAFVTDDFGDEQPTLVPYQPPAPASTDACTWRWDAAASAWMPEPTAMALAAQARAERDARLQACDWVVTRATERAEPVPPAWLAYRQALRDITAHPGFPAAIEWPQPPQS